MMIYVAQSQLVVGCGPLEKWEQRPLARNQLQRLCSVALANAPQAPKSPTGSHSSSPSHLQQEVPALREARLRLECHSSIILHTSRWGTWQHRMRYLASKI